VLTRLLGFAGVPVDETIVAHAVERSSFQSMRRLELSGSAPRYRSSGAGVFATGDVREPNALHVRKGTVGGYRDELDPGAAAALEQRIGAEMPPWYGYGAPPARDGDVA
jgi:hypothetical protein